MLRMLEQHQVYFPGLMLQCADSPVWEDSLHRELAELGTPERMGNLNNALVLQVCWRLASACHCRVD